MNEERSFERFVADNVARAPGGIPMTDDFYDDMQQYASQHRQRPRWLALIKEPPMRISNNVAVGSPTVRALAILAATLLFAISVSAAGMAGNRLLAADGPIVVDQSGAGDYTTITEAVNVAEDGDTILVRPGTYTEAFVIEKGITVMGDGPVEEIVLEAPVEGPGHETGFEFLPDPVPFAILLLGSDAELSGLTLRGESARLFADGGAPVIEDLSFESVGGNYSGSSPVTAAMVINGDSTATIRDSSFRGGSGIDVYEGAEPLIEGNEFIDGPGVFGQYGANTIIRGNSFVGPGLYGVSFWEPASARVEDNTITDRTTGIRGVLGASIITGNRVSGAGTAIDAAGAMDPEITGNVLTGNDTGITVGGNESLIADNELRDNDIGVTLSGDSPTLRGNTITGGQVGINIGGNTDASLSGNVVCDNETNVRLSGEAEVDLSGNEICEDAPA